jgi:hypothetical protein
VHDVLCVLLSVGLPWVAGTLWVAALQRPPNERSWLLSAGYGYPIGALATTLVMRTLSALGLTWSVSLVALPLTLLAAGGYLLTRPGAPWRGAWKRSDAYHATPPSLRFLFWACLSLIVIRLIGLAAEDALRPLLPWDAWAQWATKARVWYQYGRLLPFVPPREWLAAGDPLHFMDARSGYPATVPLLQVWSALCLGRWDESLINAPWPAMACALGLAFYAQARRLGAGPAAAMLCTYLVLSLPFLDIHVALAGNVDLFMAVAYALAVMALWRWTLARNRADAILALVMALGCVTLKIEGIFWALTLVPAVIVALNRRLGLWVVGLSAAAAVLYVLVGPEQVVIFGYALGTRFTNVSEPLLAHLLVMDNWHLLWYAAIVMVIAKRRALLAPELAPMSVTMLFAFAFVFVVFFYSSAAGGVDEESLVNRLPLHLVPALAFYLLVLWRRGRTATVAGAANPSPQPNEA